jgi:hypothetical protein
VSSGRNITVDIQKYLDCEATGALFLKLTYGQLLQLFFIDGQIQSMKFYGVMGIDALSMLDSHGVITSQFHQGAISRVVNQLSKTADTVDMIFKEELEQASSKADLINRLSLQRDESGYAQFECEVN